MARLPTPGGDNGNWGTILNDYLSQTHNSDGTLKPDSVGSTQIADGSLSETLLDTSVQAKLNATGDWSTLANKPAVIAAGADASAARGAIGAPRVIYVDTRDSGITFDGVTDDTSAWGSFISSLVAGDTIVLPPKKTSIISGWLNFASTLTDIKILGNGCTLKLAASSANGTTMVQLVGARAYVHGLSLDGSKITGATGIRSRGDQQTITSCDFRDCTAGNIYFQGTSFGTKITQNNFRGDAYGICTDNSSTIHHLTIANNSFDGGAKGDAIEINTPTGSAADITIVGNVIRNYTTTDAEAAMGIGLAKVNRFTISQNIISGCALDGIHVEDDSSFFTISDNSISSCGRSGISIQLGAGIGSPPRRFSITGNTVSGCLTASGSGGIAIESTSITGGAVMNNSISGCGRAGATVYGIELGGGASRLKVIGNDVSNTVGNLTAGIRWNALTKSLIVGNTLYDDQGTQTQLYGMVSGGVCTDLTIIGNNCLGNKTGAIDESSLSTASYHYLKRENFPSTMNNPDELATYAGAITTDAQWVTAFKTYPNSGLFYYDTTNNKLVICVGTNSYKSVALT